MLPLRARDGNKGIHRIPKSSSITGPSSSDCLVSYPGHSLGKSYPSAEMQSLYSAAPTDWVTLVGGVLPLWRDAVSVFWSPPTAQLTGSHSLWVSYLFVGMHSVYSTAPVDRATLVGEVLPLCRYAVGVFCSPSWLDHTRWGSLTSLQRRSQCILEP